MLSRNGVGSDCFLSGRGRSDVDIFGRVGLRGLILSDIETEFGLMDKAGVGAREGSCIEWIEDEYRGVAGEELVEDVFTDRLDEDGDG